jgi:hypothetical protein
MDNFIIENNSIDDEYENLSEYEKKIYDIKDQLDNVQLFLDQAVEEYKYLWDNVIVTYIKENEEHGILNKLNPDTDSMKFIKFMMDNSTEYNKRIMEQKQLYVQLKKYELLKTLSIKCDINKQK